MGRILEDVIFALTFAVTMLFVAVVAILSSGWFWLAVIAYILATNL